MHESSRHLNHQKHVTKLVTATKLVAATTFETCAHAHAHANFISKTTKPLPDSATNTNYDILCRVTATKLAKVTATKLVTAWDSLNTTGVCRDKSVHVILF
jgi:hypothetical protein